MCSSLTLSTMASSSLPPLPAPPGPAATSTCPPRGDLAHDSASHDITLHERGTEARRTTHGEGGRRRELREKGAPTHELACAVTSLDNEAVRIGSKGRLG